MFCYLLNCELYKAKYKTKWLKNTLGHWKPSLVTSFQTRYESDCVGDESCLICNASTAAADEAVKPVKPWYTISYLLIPKPQHCCNVESSSICNIYVNKLFRLEYRFCSNNIQREMYTFWFLAFMKAAFFVKREKKREADKTTTIYSCYNVLLLLMVIPLHQMWL